MRSVASPGPVGSVAPSGSRYPAGGVADRSASPAPAAPTAGEPGAGVRHTASRRARIAVAAPVTAARPAPATGNASPEA
ncbi:hypothetical protein MTQ17_05775 [Corynebacterium bovis]|uniref:hypothetical protein n=1 Tax=Corynebacterium bovis TaxID=36808 RepID=UPI0031397840